MNVFAFSAPFGTNGLPNAVETSADSGVINYSSTLPQQVIIVFYSSFVHYKESISQT
jgi:hypothetical protein